MWSRSDLYTHFTTCGVGDEKTLSQVPSVYDYLYLFIYFSLSLLPFTICPFHGSYIMSLGEIGPRYPPHLSGEVFQYCGRVFLKGLK